MASMSAPESTPLVELTARLARFPADRYPVQHATASFQLGFALTAAGRFAEAERALAVAAELFGPDRPTEHAKALNARGAALRSVGSFTAAAACFTEAAAVFAEAARPLERGAALFNLGLVRRELGEDPEEALAQARGLLAPDRVPGHAAAAARELGAALLTGDRAGEAVAVLEEAVALAERAGDLPGLGAASNTLGLAHLAVGHPEAAIAALRDAVGAHPRSVRPEGLAMAKANLALAHERIGDHPRARFAARQALGVPGVADAVRATAAGVLARLGTGPGRLVDLLAAEPGEQWPVLVREELFRWADAEPADQLIEADELVAGVLARPAEAAELVASWLGGVLELPPDAMHTLVAHVLRALQRRGPEDVERFRSLVSRGCARFHVPQMERLTRLFEELAAEHGGPASWR
jgi:tetratricopeptide (TPR) repeat protein